MTDRKKSYKQKNGQEAENRSKTGVRSGLIGICCNILLFAIKLVAGILGGHISVLVDAFNNLTDMASSVVTLAGFKIAGKPADEKHPYGHGRMEYIAGQIVSFVIMIVGATLLRSSIEKIIRPEPVIFTLTALVILLCSIGIKLWMWGYNRKVGTRIGSETLIATAKDSLNDSIATTAVLVSMIVEAVTGVSIDGWAGAGVAIFIIISGIISCRDTMAPLLGAMPSKELTDEIRRQALSEEKIIGVHDLMVHDYGPGRRYVSLHAEVPASMGIMAAHDLIHKVENKIMANTDCDVTIHMDPVEKDDKETIRLKTMVSKILYTMDKDLMIHDFRILQREPKKIIYFDVVIPGDRKDDSSVVAEKIKNAINTWEPEIETQITIDRLFEKTAP